MTQYDSCRFVLQLNCFWKSTIIIILLLLYRFLILAERCTYFRVLRSKRSNYLLDNDRKSAEYDDQRDNFFYDIFGFTFPHSHPTSAFLFNSFRNLPVIIVLAGRFLFRRKGVFFYLCLLALLSFHYLHKIV